MMSDFADDLNEWVARQAQSSVDDQVLAAYSAENPAPEGQEWFIAGQQRDGDEVAYRFDLRAAES
ncbi:hypothetical protein [Microbacterium sp. PI-1]|uniref:hypothetical protein n=1 Tax=Microbacterium sp. PI-1 TaxID=2545631 RepID=UPI00197B6D9D|nr:hypothetical protein [Microbacterium sp. PI-1]